MSDLIPTPVVDKNGRLTTVHKRAGKQPASTLGAIKPVLNAPHEATEQTHVVKGTALHPQSLALRLFSDDEPQQYRLTRSSDEYEWRKQVEVSDSDLYSYLRLGVDAVDAATLHGLGITPDSLPDHPELGVHLPGRLGRFEGKKAYQCISNSKVIDRFQAVGITAIEAERAVMNHVQNEFLDKSLDEHQLLQLFSRKKYHAASWTGRRVSDRVINCFIRGYLPLTVLDIPTEKIAGVMAEMETIDNAVFKTISAEPELYEKLIRKAVQTGAERVQDLYGLLVKFGPGVMDMDDPYLCSVSSRTDSESHEVTAGSIHSGRYLDRVQQIAREHGFKCDNNYKYEWWGGVIVNGVLVENASLERLRVNGISPEEAYIGLVINRLNFEQVIIGKEDDVPNGLAGGAL